MFRRFPRSFAVILSLFLFPLFSVNADSFFDDVHFSYNASLALFANGTGQTGADPSQIVPAMGLSAAKPFWGPLRVEIAEDIYFTNYEFNERHGFPTACNPENRASFVLGFVTAIQLTGFIPIGANGAAARIYAGPAFDLRLVTIAFGLNHPSDKEPAETATEATRNYFWSNGRMVISTAGVGMDFPLNEKFKIGFDIRVWAPLYRLWTNEDIPEINGWRFGAGLRITPVK